MVTNNLKAYPYTSGSVILRQNADSSFAVHYKKQKTILDEIHR